MADELGITLDSFNDSGLTLLGMVYAADGTQEGSNVSMTETGSTAVYIGSFALGAIADGDYLVRFATATRTYGTGSLYVRDGVEVTTGTLDDAVDATIVVIGALNDFDPATDVVANVTLVDTTTVATTTTTNTDMRGTDNAALASDLVLTDVEIAAIKERTDNLPDSPSSTDDVIVGYNS